jgi:hypothetical protein
LQIRVNRLYSEDLDTHDGIDGLEIVNPFRNPCEPKNGSERFSTLPRT